MQGGLEDHNESCTCVLEACDSYVRVPWVCICILSVFVCVSNVCVPRICVS